jgi:hypothetical protein
MGDGVADETPRLYVLYLAERGEYGADTHEQVRRLIEEAGQSRTYERTQPDLATDGQEREPQAELRCTEQEEL